MDAQKKNRIGNYVILNVLGKGGFGKVYLGEHIYLKRLAAIKVMNEILSADDQENFRMEAEHIAKLDHPNIVRVQDFGIDRNIPFLAMTYAPNGTLGERHRGDRVPLATVVSYVQQVAAGLYHAHEQQLIHRDVKPVNLLVGSKQEILLSDFGIAVLAESFRRPIDSSGTLQYMAPEQLAGRPCFASDQYALGIMAYQWLSGRPPFQGNQYEMYAAHNFNAPPPLRARVPGLPLAVEQVVYTALSKRPQQRFATVLEFAAALEAASRQATVDPLAPTILEPVKDLNKTTPAQPAEEAAPLTRRRAFSIPLPINEGTKAEPLAGKSPTARAISLPQQGKKNYIYRGHTGWVTAVAWSPDGQYLASASWDEIVQVWVAGEGHKVMEHHGHSQPVKAVAWSPDGTYLASAAWDESVQIWHVKNEQLDIAIGPLGGQIETVAWSPDGAYIAAADHNGKAYVWNRRGSLVLRYEGHTGPIWGLAWSEYGNRIATASYDGTVQVWEALSGHRLITYDKHNNWVAAVAWSGTRIASAGHNGIVHIWDGQSGENKKIYNGHKHAVKALAWSPQGKYIASADKEIQIWNVQTGESVATNDEQHDWINMLSWSPDERKLAAASDSQTVLVWEVAQFL